MRRRTLTWCSGCSSCWAIGSSPRIADIGDTRYWRAEWPGDPAGDYGPLNAIARNKVNLSKVVQRWPDMLRVAGSLVTNKVRAYHEC